MRSDKRNNTSKKTSKPEKTNSDKAPKSVSDKIYPGHSTFGELTNKSSHIRNLQHLRNDVPDDVRGHLDDVVQELTRSQKKHFLKVIASLSNDQYHHVLTHITSIFDFRKSGSAQWCLRQSRYFFRMRIRILAGEHPHTKAQTRARNPRVPIAPPIKKPDVGDVGLRFEGPKWLELQERLNNLPIEIFHMIKEIAVEDLLLKKYIYPHHDRSGVYNAAKGSEEWFSSLPCELLEVFQSKVKRKAMSRRLLRDNMYIIGPGDVAATTNFITHSHPRLQKKMHRFRLILSREAFYVSAAERPFGDYKGLCDEFLLFMDTDLPVWSPSLFETLGFLQVINGQYGAPYRRDRPRDADEPDQLGCPEGWTKKIQVLLRNTNVSIKKLDLDLTDAYSPDGTYMGEQIAPPSIELEAKIRQAILDTNGVKPSKPVKAMSEAAREESAPPLEILSFDD